MSPSKRKFRWGIMRSTGIKRYIDPISGCKIWRTNRKCRIPIDLYPCKVEESMTMKKVGDQTIGVIRRRRIDKEGNVSRFQEYHTSDEEEEELSEHPPYNKYGFVDHPQLQMEDQRNKFAPYPLPPQEGNMNGWLIDDANDSDLESTASNQPMSLTMEDIDDKLEKKTIFPTVAKIEFVRPKQQEKPVRKPANCNYHQKERVVSENNYTRVNYHYSAKKAHPSAHRNMVPRAFLMKTGLRSLNTARPVNTAHPKTTVYSARPMSHFSKSAQSTVKWPYQIRTTLTNKFFSQKVNTAKGSIYTARLNSAVVNAVRANQVNVVKASACWVWRPTKLNSASITLKIHNYVDARGNSKHMTWNMSYPSDFKEFDGGYVTFGGGAKGGKITGKGTLKTGKLDFEDVYFVKELQFNLFSVSQMRDKKNSVLFTDTGCFILSLDFKLADESQATLDESMIWHRRLGHIKFKTINKLVKENLVRGLPLKRFKNDQTCVACLKGKQHKASNLVDKKVKIIRCDNGTEFKNRVMSEFCEKKGIKKEFSVARTPQQNGVAERRNRTLIEAARTIIGCHVTILNTLDYLGKFDGKSDEGFFVGYSLNSKAFRVYNIRTRKVEENLHIRFLEDKPIIAGDGPKWLFDIDVLTKSMNYVPVVAGTNSNDFVDGSLFDSSSKNASNDEPQPSSDAGKKDDEGVCKESGIDDQERPENSTQDVNTAGPSINTEPDMFSLGDNATLEATHADFFGDETEVNMSNITTTYLVPSTLNTRIHKDHSLDHVIGDVHSGVQTRRMTKTTNEQGFISAVYEGKTHEDLHTCLFACFLSQEEPKRIAKALSDSAWVEAMQKELLQLVAQGYTQEEGIDYDDVFSPVARIEILTIPDKSTSGEQALYGLHSSSKTVIKLGQMSSMRELTFFLGLQVKQKEDGIFISQDKYVADILRKFSFTDVRTASTPIDTEKPLLKDSDVAMMWIVTSLHSMIDSLIGYAGASLDRKSTTGGCQFLGCRLISWQCKKKTVCVSLRTSGLETAGKRKSNTFVLEGLVVQGKGSTNPVESHRTPTSAPSTSQPPVSPTSRKTTRQESMVPQPRSPTQTPVVDEVASTGVDVRYGGATTTVTGLEAGRAVSTKNTRVSTADDITMVETMVYIRKSAVKDKDK
ncbi:putative ribonuclease H-like domain-containing protein, partial [Tanacetum coccineum]